MWIRETLGQILRNQMGDVTYAGFMTPPAVSGQSQAQGSLFNPRVDRTRGDGILPSPPTAIPLKSTEKQQPLALGETKSELPVKLLELPLYEGQNPEEWIYRVERCFEANKTEKVDKLKQAMACLTGTVVTWLRYVKDRDVVKDWMDFKDKFKERFGPSIGGSFVDQLMGITPKGTVDEYRERFEELPVEVPHVSNDVAESMFLKGLKWGLRDQVLRCQPTGINAIVAAARLIERQESDSPSYTYRPVQKAFSTQTFQQANCSANNSPKRSSEYHLVRGCMTQGETLRA